MNYKSSVLFTCLSYNEPSAVLDDIEHHRNPAKNALIIQISFKLGLLAQEMTLLLIRVIVALSDESARGYKVKDVFSRYLTICKTKGNAPGPRSYLRRAGGETIPAYPL